MNVTYIVPRAIQQKFSEASDEVSNLYQKFMDYALELYKEEMFHYGYGDVT